MPSAPARSAARKRLSATEFDVANRAFFRLYQSSNLMHKIGTRAVADFGCTTQQWAVMGALAREKGQVAGITVKELMEFLSVTRQNITPLLDRLEDRGWIERLKDDTDARSRRVRLTRQGTGLWAQLQKPIEEFYRESLMDLSVEDQLTLCRLLDSLKKRMSQM